MARIVPLQDALKRTRPFRSAAQEAGLSLLRAADAFRRSLTAVVEPHGITMQQYNVLRILRGAGERGLPTLAVGERMIERTPGVTRLLDRLEKDGLVLRTRCAEDRRRVYARITSEGLAILERIDGPLAETEDRVFRGFDADALHDLVHLLERVRSELEGGEADAPEADGTPSGEGPGRSPEGSAASRAPRS